MPWRATIMRIRFAGKRQGRLTVRLFIFCFLSFVGTLIVTGALERRYARRAEDESSFLMPHRQCTSPERHVRWPLSGSTQSASSTLTCGITGNTPLSDYFSDLADSLKKAYATKCHESVRFGVAFGAKHLVKLKPHYKSSQNCSFMLVIKEEMPLLGKDANSQGMEILVPVPRRVLPYKSMRRNVKLFKLHGHEFFPWTNYLVWQDVKLKIKFPVVVPTEYYAKFLLARSPCVTAVGLPRHESAFGHDSSLHGYQPKYQDHCDTIVSSIQARPNVTDSAEALLQQCKTYQSGGVTLDRSLIDSALIIWNQQTSTCREFNAKLTCTWLDEIQSCNVCKSRGVRIRLDGMQLRVLFSLWMKTTETWYRY